MKKMLLLFLLLTIVINVNAETLATNSKSSILLEASTGTILYENNADEQLAPASMTKMMSLLLIMEAIDSGKLSLEDTVTISSTAAEMGGSQVFLQEGETYTVDALIKTVAIASANDAVVALAEKVGGSVDTFVTMMNEKVSELGLTNTHFENPHGLDAENHYSSARDMLTIAQELIKHEKILEYSSIYEDYLQKPDGSSIWLVNTNKLVRFYEGVDGLKTGFTSTAGYCLTSTAERNGIRFITVVMGVETSDLRSSDTVELLNYGFNNFKLNTLLTDKEILGEVKVVNGKLETVNIILKEDITELLKTTDDVQTYTYNLKVDPIETEVKKGDTVGTVEIIDSDGNVVMEKEVTVSEDIVKANILELFVRNLKELSSGKMLSR